MLGNGQAFGRAARAAASGGGAEPSFAVDGARFAWPTWAVLAAVYGGWLALTLHAANLPWWVLLPAGAWLTAWHGSLQHEAIHGHPTRSPRLNTALVWLPLGLWMPYALYKESHERHHASPHLTDPGADPESFYVSPERWERMGRLRRGVYIVNQTLAGRLCVGPAFMAGRFWLEEVRRLSQGDFAHGRIWAGHAAGVAIVLAWTAGVCELPVIAYAAMFAYPGLSLTLLRSFAEHEPASEEHRRTAIVAGGPFSRLLYLNNNLHAVHHAFPVLPWFAIPAAWRARPDLFAAPDGPPLHRSYGAIARRRLFRLSEHPVHPGGPFAPPPEPAA